MLTEVREKGPFWVNVKPTVISLSSDDHRTLSCRSTYSYSHSKQLLSKCNDHRFATASTSLYYHSQRFLLILTQRMGSYQLIGLSLFFIQYIDVEGFIVLRYLKWRWIIELFHLLSKERYFIMILQLQWTSHFDCLSQQNTLVSLLYYFFCWCINFLHIVILNLLHSTIHEERLSIDSFLLSLFLFFFNLDVLQSIEVCFILNNLVQVIISGVLLLLTKLLPGFHPLTWSNLDVFSLLFLGVQKITDMALVLFKPKKHIFAILGVRLSSRIILNVWVHTNNQFLCIPSLNYLTLRHINISHVLRPLWKAHAFDGF